MTARRDRLGRDIREAPGGGFYAFCTCGWTGAVQETYHSACMSKHGHDVRKAEKERMRRMGAQMWPDGVGRPARRADA